MTGLLLRDVELDGRRADVRVGGGTITEIARALGRLPRDTVLDGRGGALLPGLRDHHLHLHALAAHDSSVHCGPPEVTTPSVLAEALHNARPDAHGWVRGVGYHESVAGPLDADVVQRLHSTRPVRIQHRSGALWVVNRSAAAMLRLDTGDHPGIERDEQGRATGRLWRADDWLRTRLPRSRPYPLGGVGQRLTRFGITAVTDATPGLDRPAIDAIADARASGALPQRVRLLGAPLDGALPPGLESGPYKIVLADSGPLDFAVLTDRIHAAHAAGRSVAVHCVTREALVLLLAAFESTGTRTGDRIEHAALVPVELIARIKDLGLRIVTQPGFLAHRGDDYLRDVPAVDHADLYRMRSLAAAGIPCVASSDAPYGPLDPWSVIDAAVRRTTPAGQIVGEAERTSAREALAGYLSPDPGGPPTRLRTGAPADLVLLHTPLADALQTPSANPVRTTLINGIPI